MPSVVDRALYFRKDIQGLRGIAVMLIVIYHSGFALPGGFIGVDVFFVISGFVITQLLEREYLKNNSGVLLSFYQRRIKRLLPASSIAVASVVLFSFLALAPENLLGVTTLARSTLYFGANFKLLPGPGYFTSVNPLEHLWSLAVEEQLYIFYPILFHVLFKFFGKHRNRKSVLGTVLIGLGALSFLGNVILSSGSGTQIISQYFQTSPERFAFFMMPTRVWEFVIGSILALQPKWSGRSNVMATSSAVAGFVAIGLASISFNATTTFPGFAALLPVCGTALVIFFSPNASFIRMSLEGKMLSYLGKISYSWYLWHWPAIVFSRLLFPENSLILVFAICISFVLAVLSNTFIELSFLSAPTTATKRRLPVVICSVSICALSPIIAIRSISHLERLIYQRSEISQPSFGVLHGCLNPNNSDIEPSCVVENGKTNKTAFLIGDSQAGAASDGIARAAGLAQIDFALQSFDGCPPFPIEDGDGCYTTRPITDQTIKDLDPQIVVVAVALNRYIKSGQSIDQVPQFVLNYLEYIQHLAADGRSVIVLLEVPEVNISGQKSILRPNFFTKATLLSNQVRREAWRNMVKTELQGVPDVTVVDVDTIFCPSGICNPKQNGTLLYYNPQHLTVAGSDLLSPIFVDTFTALNN